MKIGKALIVYTKPKRKEEKEALDHIKGTLKKYDIKYKIRKREKLKAKFFRNMDLILAFGGDGTFLMASHYVLDKVPMFGINSDPSTKEGFFMTANNDDFEKKLRRIINNSFKIKKLQRLEAYIGKKRIPDLALNEYYVASEKPYHTARYYLNVRGKRERQKSSGVLVSTAAGSYAWVKSAGGKELPLYSDDFEYIIREPYCGRTAAKCRLFNDILKKYEKIVIEFEIGNGIIIADSTATEHKFKAGEKVTIRLSKKPLNVISFDNR
ncbi:NAD(+)/NADH kinase [Candidatus Woesearchaeota archaeon]|nr:NAD(+)/NADH kinase [Candidatus Woesearchaeota archaeon]